MMQHHTMMNTTIKKPLWKYRAQISRPDMAEAFPGCLGFKSRIFFEATNHAEAEQIAEAEAARNGGRLEWVQMTGERAS